MTGTPIYMQQSRHDDGRMTREEAIADIKNNIKPVVGGKSLDMAIEALSADTVPIEKYHELQHQFVMLGAAFADLTEVVRCKDCKYITEHYDTNGNAPYWTCSEWDSGTDYDGFCHYGERRK